MRIKKIAAQCKAQGNAILWDVTDSDGVIKQWINTAAAAYPVDGMPYLREDHLPALLSLSNKDIEKMRIEAAAPPETFDLRDAVESEGIAEPAEFSINYLDRELRPVRVYGVTYFVDEALMSPITAEYKDTELWLRQTKNGIQYFAVKAGLMCVGIVMPLVQMQHLINKLGEVVESYPGDPQEAWTSAAEAENELDGQEELT